MQFIERTNVILAESPATYKAWRQLLAAYNIEGVAVHDARLVAMMQTAAINHIPWLNFSFSPHGEERRHEKHSESGLIDGSYQSNYSDYMITNLREAKSNLSQLVQRAAEGEEIVITVRGRPTARLTSVAPNETQAVARTQWAEELSAAAEAARVGPRKSTTQQVWDDMRQERL